MPRLKSASKLPTIMFLLLTMIVLSVGCLASQNPIPTPFPQHTATGIYYTPIWSKSNIYVVWNGFSPMLGAQSGKVCFLGGLSSSSQDKLTCLNSKTGDLLWQTTSGVHTAFYPKPDGLYVAYSDTTGVSKYSLDGKLIWSESMFGNGSVYLQSSNNQIDVLVTPDIYYLLKSETGEVIRKIKSQNVIYYDENQYLKYLSSLDAYSSSDQKMIWSVKLDDVLELAPLVKQDNLMVRTGRIFGSAYAIERKAGKILWRTESNIISTIAYSPSNNKAYIFSLNGHLIEINMIDGNERTIAEFNNQEFVLRGDALVGGYEVSLDEANKILFLYLGDSRQLFAFQMN